MILLAASSSGRKKKKCLLRPPGLHGTFRYSLAATTRACAASLNCWSCLRARSCPRSSRHVLLETPEKSRVRMERGSSIEPAWNVDIRSAQQTFEKGNLLRAAKFDASIA